MSEAAAPPTPVTTAAAPVPSAIADTAPVATPAPTPAPIVHVPAPTTTTVPPAAAVDVLPPAPLTVASDDSTVVTVANTTVAAAPASTPTSNPPAPIKPAEITSPSGASAGGDASKPAVTADPALPSSTTTTAGPSSDPDEPQTPLTKKFTADEWKALFEFRTELPAIFAAAFPNADKSKPDVTSITIWGISVDPVNPRKDPRVSVILMKFLRARNLSIREAGAMLINTLRWRASFNIDAALKEDFPQEIFGNLGHLFGRDKEKRPVVYNVYGGNQDLKAVFGDVDRFIRWRIALMERSVDQLDFLEVDQTVQIHDYEGVGLTSRDANSKAAAAEATNLFQSHYPELLHKKFFINVPTLLNWIFWAFKPLLSANTLAKMSVVGTGHHSIKKALSEHIDLKELPVRYGGEAQAF